MKSSTVTRTNRALALTGLVLCLAEPAMGQNLAAFEKRVTEFSLSNGLKIIAVERLRAPVVTCFTYADVGAVDEVIGITGVSHLFEHLAFKGTATVGTKDCETEAKLMARTDELYQAIKLARRKGANADDESLSDLFQEFAKAQHAEEDVIVHDEFAEILKRAGGTGLNARTNYDSTGYWISLPSNRLELWMLMESHRFRWPVLREFYKEKKVVMEERRQRFENNPVGRLGEELLALAYRAHPYGEPAIGHMSDLQTITRAEAQAFFDKHYCPSNLTLAIVGDVDPHRVRELAQAYFGSMPCRTKPEPVETEEPPQGGERRVVVKDTAQPILLIAYHKTRFTHPDDVVFDTMSDILGAGRTARLHKSLVEEERIAISATSFSGTPGNKYPGLYTFYAVPAKDHTSAECEEAIDAEIERLKNEPVSDEELKRAKTRARARLIRSLTSSLGLASQMAFYEVVAGDWRQLFNRLDQIEQVSTEDIQRVAATYFVTTNRTVGMIDTVSPPR